MYWFPLFEILRNFPVWSLDMKPSAFWTVMKTIFVFLFSGACVGSVFASSMAAVRYCDETSNFGRPRLDLVVVEPFPFWIWRMWPILVASSMPIYLLMAFAVKPGHPLR